MVAFVLSGGASHGAVQIGMLRALAEAGIVPDALYGTSVGAINASVVSHLPPADRLEVLSAAWRNFAEKPPIRPSLARNAIAAVRRRPALTDPSPLRAQLEETFGDARIEDAATPLFVAATNLLDGQERLFDRGSLVEMLMASCAVPGLFPPVEIEGTPYIDGLLYGAPAAAAVEDGHDTLYLLLTNSTLAADKVPTTWWGIARRAATMVMWNQLTVPLRGRAADLTVHTVPAPASMAGVGRWDFAHTGRLLADSYETAGRWLSALPDEELVSIVGPRRRSRDRRRVAVLGAGLTGLAAAHLLAASGEAGVDVFEARDVPGGRANVEDGAEHCQRLFLSDYRTLLPLLGQIPYDASSSVRDRLVPMRRFVQTPTLGLVEISHQYSLFAPELGPAEKLRIARASRESILLARQLRGDTNFLGAPRNRYSIGAKLAVARTFLRRQTAFALPGATDAHFIEPWTKHLASMGVGIHLSAAVERIAAWRDGVELHIGSRRERYDAVISTLFVSSLRTLLERSGIRHRLPRDEHAHCPCFTISFDPAERSPHAAVPALYSHQGIGVVVQPELRRCTALCVRSPRSDREWVLPRIAEILGLSHPLAAVRCRPNAAADEALFIGNHIRRDRVLLGSGFPRLQVAGSWTRDGYPVDSGESAALSALGAVRAVCRSLGLPAPVRPGGGVV